MEEESLWVRIGNKCLQQALQALDDAGDPPTSESIGRARMLVDLALDIDRNELYRQTAKNRYGELTRSGRFSLQNTAED